MTRTAPRSIQGQITWAVFRAMTTAEFDAYAISAKDIDAKPERGTVTLDNGQRRVAQYIVGNLTSGRFLSYQTPAGRWIRCTAAVEATFQVSATCN